MENKKREIAKFYEQIFLDAKLEERLEEKVKKIANEEDFRILIREEIMPLMKKFKVNFSEEELLEYEEETLKKLSKEALSNVSGGVSIKSALLTGGLLSMALLGGVGLNSSIASADSGKGNQVQTGGKGQTQSDGEEEEEEEEEAPDVEANKEKEEEGAPDVEANKEADNDKEKLKKGFFYGFDNSGYRYECCNFETFFNHFKKGKDFGELSEATLGKIDWDVFKDKIFIFFDPVTPQENWEEGDVNTHKKNWVVPATLNVNGKNLKVGGIISENSERIDIRKLSLSEGINNFIFDNNCFNLPWGWMTINADDEEKVFKLVEVDFSNVTGQLVLGQKVFNESKIKSVKFSPYLKSFVALKNSFGNNQLEYMNFTAEKLYLESGAFGNNRTAEKVDFSNNCKDVEIKGTALFGVSCHFKEVNVPVCNFTAPGPENPGQGPDGEATINYPTDFSEDFSIKQGNGYLFRIAETINCPKNVNNFVVEDKALSVGLKIGDSLKNFVNPEKIRGNADIGNEAFILCQIDSFNIDNCDGDINIHDMAFAYSSNKSVNLNSNGGNINISSGAFYHNKQLEEITLSAPNDVNIAKDAFESCDNIKKINICCKGNVNIDISNFYNLHPDLEVNIRAKNLSFKNTEKIFKVDSENLLWKKTGKGNEAHGRRFCKKVVFNGFPFTAQNLIDSKFQIDNNNERQKALRTTLELQFNDLEPQVLPELRTDWFQAKNSNRLMVIGNQVYTTKSNSSGKVTLDKLVVSLDEKVYTYSLAGALQDGSWVNVENDNHPDFIKDNNQIETINFGPGIKEVSFENDLFKGNKSLKTLDFRTATDLENVTFGSSSCEGSNLTNILLPKQGVNFNADSNAFGGTPIATFAAPSKMLFFREPIQDQAKRVLKCLNSCTDFEYLFKYILNKNSIKNLATSLNNVKSAIKLNSVTGEWELSGINLTSSECQKIINAAETIDDYIE